MGKPAGIRTARKHVKNRRIQRWADLDYKKAHLGTRWKANPFGGASHAKGIVLEKVTLFKHTHLLQFNLVNYFRHKNHYPLRALGFHGWSFNRVSFFKFVRIG